MTKEEQELEKKIEVFNAELREIFFARAWDGGGSDIPLHRALFKYHCAISNVLEENEKEYGKPFRKKLRTCNRDFQKLRKAYKDFMLTYVDFLRNVEAGRAK